ncbi:hypothetical protein SKAU_G00145730 [Synaphobranchus kaupii]|uniref:Uncharacterized protein n=1 Tax=Synaphobranchus kaupii TaxID=118154 RepID=A0A9Q1FU56_SYNKA|nr:hypothetical protein SKAU_G00145730 [Synaphobranchus kaupii]
MNRNRRAVRILRAGVRETPCAARAARLRIPGSHRARAETGSSYEKRSEAAEGVFFPLANGGTRPSGREPFPP